MIADSYIAINNGSCSPQSTKQVKICQGKETSKLNPSTLLSHHARLIVD